MGWTQVAPAAVGSWPYRVRLGEGTRCSAPLGAVVSLVALAACAGSGRADDTAAAADHGAFGSAGAGVERLLATMPAERGAYARLQALCDGHGHRLSGSPGLEAAIAWAVEALKRDGHEAVAAEPVRVPVWVRGVEQAAIVEPVAAGQEVPLALLGLGGSDPTPAEGITAEVLRVSGEEELQARGAEAKGRIVLFDNPMPAWTEAHGSGYGHCVKYRVHGARIAARHGAVAVLVRSVTARSLRSPHTGAMLYGDSGARLPAAALSTEDADRIGRLLATGQRVRVRLTLGGRNMPEADSANVVAELRGRERPEEVVILSGHLDSWDVGQGAHDDGAGVVMAMEALHQLRRLGLRPRRTLRVVLWTNEESGMAGIRAYLKRHKAEIPDHAAAIEADAGGFAPVGFGLFLEDKAAEARYAATLEPLTRLLRPLGAIRVVRGQSAPDVSRFHPLGVPALGLMTHGAKYFDYHHSHADTVDKVDPDELQRSATALAALGYWLAELPELPPKPAPSGATEPD